MLNRRERAQLKRLKEEQTDKMITNRAERKLFTGKRLSRKERRLLEARWERESKRLMEQVRADLRGEAMARAMSPYNHHTFGAKSV